MVINFKSSPSPSTLVSFSATSFYTFPSQYRNFGSFNIYLCGISRQIFSSRPKLEFSNSIFLSNPYKIYFCTLVGMASIFFVKSLQNIISHSSSYGLHFFFVKSLQNIFLHSSRYGLHFFLSNPYKIYFCTLVGMASIFFVKSLQNIILHSSSYGLHFFCQILTKYIFAL